MGKINNSTINHIRTEYEKIGVENYYINNSSKYINPHLNDIETSIEQIVNNEKIDLSSILDMSCGNGEITNKLLSMRLTNIEGSDLYMCDEYKLHTNLNCMKLSFKDIQQGKLKKKYSTIFCSYALHLANITLLPYLLWELSFSCKFFILLEPTKKPIINEDAWILINSFINGKCKVRIFKSKNY
jgi:2-polyprenyl-3-methyl-5-hydroxy-6-metoxy-1,4-benzoquinol methylase